MLRALLILALLALSACASTRTRPVDALVAGDASFIAGEVAAYVSAELPPASSTVWLALPPELPASSKIAPSPIGPAVAAALRDRGFAVVEDSAASDGAHAVSVDALELAGSSDAGAGVLLKVSIDGAAASRWYERDGGGSLAAAGAYTVRAAR